MANLASSAVTTVSSWTEGGPNGRRQIAKIVRLALTGQGGATNLISASALGFTKIEQCSNAILSDNSLVYVAVPLYGGTAIGLVPDWNAATAIPADATGVTIELTVKGY
jgi:hypothetical protein